MRNSPPTYTTIIGTKLRETEKAYHFKIDSVEGEGELEIPVTAWIPISQCNSSFTDPNSDGEDKLSVADWILQKLEVI